MEVPQEHFVQIRLGFLLTYVLQKNDILKARSIIFGGGLQDAVKPNPIDPKQVSAKLPSMESADYLADKSAFWLIRAALAGLPSTQCRLQENDQSRYGRLRITHEILGTAPALRIAKRLGFAHVYWPSMQIIATATAFPPHYFPQEEVVEALTTHWNQSPGKMPRHWKGFTPGQGWRADTSPSRWSSTLRSIPGAKPTMSGSKPRSGWVSRRSNACSTRQAWDREQIGALFFVSVTGVSSPSVDARLVDRMRLSPRIKRNPIFGLGCVAGAAGLARAADYVRAYPDQIAVLLSVELCSLTFQRDDFTVANLIATGLFGDGAAAVLVAGEQVKLKGPRILGSACSFYPDTQGCHGLEDL